MADNWILYGEGDKDPMRPRPGETFRTVQTSNGGEHDCFTVLGVTGGSGRNWRAMIASPRLGYRIVMSSSSVWSEYERFTSEFDEQRARESVLSEVDALLEG